VAGAISDARAPTYVHGSITLCTHCAVNHGVDVEVEGLTADLWTEGRRRGCFTTLRVSVTAKTVPLSYCDYGRKGRLAHFEPWRRHGRLEYSSSKPTRAWWQLPTVHLGKTRHTTAQVVDAERRGHDAMTRTAG